MFEQILRILKRMSVKGDYMLLPLQKKKDSGKLSDQVTTSACPALVLTSQWINLTFPLTSSRCYGHRHLFKNLIYGSINKENHLPEWWKKQEVNTPRRRHCLSTVFRSAHCEYNSTGCYIIFY